MEINHQTEPTLYIRTFRNMGGGVKEKQAIVLLSGKINLVNGKRSSTLKAPALYLINDRQIYDLRGISAPEAYTFKLSGHLQVKSCLSEHDYITQTLPSPKARLFSALLEHLSNTTIIERTDPYGSSNMADSYRRLLNLELRQLLNSPRKCRRLKMVNHFQELVGQHYRTERGLTFYASHLCISENYLYKVVKQITGQTPSGIIQQQLFLEAASCLEFTNLSIKEIAFQLDFKEDTYFIRFFKKHTGLTPGQYRKLRLQENREDLSRMRKDMCYKQEVGSI